MNDLNGGLNFEVGLDSKQLAADAARIKAQLNGIGDTGKVQGSRLENAFNKVGTSLDKIGINIPSMIGPAAALAAAFKFKQLADEAVIFENEFGMAMREVQTISKAVQEDFEGISEAIVNMAANGPDGAIKLAKAYYQIVSAGYDGAAGLKLLDISSKAATAGVTETAVAADGLTTVLNAWGLSADKAENVADVMFKTVERGKTTFGELASSIAQVAPLASANNISFEEIFASLQTITKQGTPTAQAMTQIRSAIINMNSVLGDGWSEVMTFQDGLEKVSQMAGGSQTALKALVPDIEAVSGVLALTGEKAKGAAEDLDETTKSTGAMSKAYGAMMEEADNKWSLVHNKWTREMRALGKSMKEGSSMFADFFNDLLTNEKTDIIDPAAQKIVDDTAASVGNLATKEEKLAAVIAKINQLQSKRVKELYPEAAKLDKQQPGGLVRGIETFNAGIGLPTSFTPGRIKQTELEMYNKEIAITQQAEKNLFALYNEISKSKDLGSAETVKTIRTLKDINEEIAAAKKNQEGASTKTEFNNIQNTIDRLEVEKAAIVSVKEAVDQIKKAKEDLETAAKSGDEAAAARAAKRLNALEQEKQKLEDIIVLQMKRAWRSQFDGQSMEDAPTIGPKPVTQSGGAKASDKYKLEVGKLKAWEEEQNEKAAEAQEDLDQETFENKKKFQEQLIEGAMRFTDELIEQLGISEAQAKTLRDMTNFIGAAASGNWIGAAFQAVSMVVGTLKEETVNFLEVTNEQISKTNASLSLHSKLLGGLDGNEYFKASAENLKRINLELDGYNKKLSAIEVRDNLSHQKINTSGWDSAQWLKALDNSRMSINGGKEATAAILAQIAELKAEKESLINEIYQNILGFGVVDVSNSIFEGIKDGLKLGEKGLGGFAGKFGEFMKTALMQSVTDAMELDIANTFLPKYKDAMNDGILSEKERKDLENIYAGLVKQGETDNANIKSITDPYLTNTDQRTGSSKGLAAMTQDTGEELNGRFTVIQGHTFRMADSLDILKANSSALLGHVIQIKGHTESMQSDMKSVKNDIGAVKMGIDTINLKGITLKH